MTVPLCSHALSLILSSAPRQCPCAHMPLSLILSSAPRQCPCAHMPYPSFYHLHHDSVPVLTCPIPHFIICTMTVPLCSHALSLILSSAPRQCPCAHMPYPSFYHLHHDSAPVLTCPYPSFYHLHHDSVPVLTFPIPHFIICTTTVSLCSHPSFYHLHHDSAPVLTCPYPSFYHLHHDSAPVLICPIPHFIICITTVPLCSHALSLILSSAPRQCPCAHMPYPSFYHLHHDSVPVLTCPIPHFIICITTVPVLTCPIPHFIICTMTVPLSSHALSLILSSAPRQCPCAHMPYPSFYHLHHDSVPVLTCPIPHFIICTTTVSLCSYALSLILSSAP